MKLKNNYLLLSLSSLLIISSCLYRKDFSEKVILFKQVNESTDLEVDFKITRFWQMNFEDKTFITQDFSSSSFDRILDSVKVLNYVNDIKPQFNDYVEYAFVKYKKNKHNDTVYFDGHSKWWIIQEGNIKQYNEEKEKMKSKLQYAYPIFRDCTPSSGEIINR